MNEFFAKYSVHGITAGNTGAQMGGWFRKEVKTVADMKGLKFRVGGFAGQVLPSWAWCRSRSPAATSTRHWRRAPSTPPNGSAPTTTRSSGFYKVAPYYYYPGFWEGGPSLTAFVNKAKYDELPPVYKAILKSAGDVSTVVTQAKYDALNPPALKKLVAQGAQLRPFSQEILEASYKAALEVYAETSASNPDFKKVYDSYAAFRSDQYLWWQVAEYTYDSFMIRARAKG